MTERNEMVEAVARALIERIGSPWAWGDMSDEVRALWEGHARAAIAAMKPTDAMKLAGARSIGETMRIENHTVRADKAFQAMIDEILKP